MARDDEEIEEKLAEVEMHIDVESGTDERHLGMRDALNWALEEVADLELE